MRSDRLDGPGSAARAAGRAGRAGARARRLGQRERTPGRRAAIPRPSQRLERILTGPARDSMLASIALLTGELYRTRELAPDASDPRWSPTGALLAYEIGGDSARRSVLLDANTGERASGYPGGIRRRLLARWLRDRLPEPRSTLPPFSVRCGGRRAQRGPARPDRPRLHLPQRLRPALPGRDGRSLLPGRGALCRRFRRAAPGQGRGAAHRASPARGRRPPGVHDRGRDHGARPQRSDHGPPR